MVEVIFDYTEDTEIKSIFADVYLRFITLAVKDNRIGKWININKSVSKK
jgi:hypothetical protein